jgi:hypothetical protein
MQITGSGVIWFLRPFRDISACIRRVWHEIAGWTYKKSELLLDVNTPFSRLQIKADCHARIASKRRCYSNILKSLINKSRHSNNIVREFNHCADIFVVVKNYFKAFEINRFHINSLSICCEKNNIKRRVYGLIPYIAEEGKIWKPCIRPPKL